jgi:mRNA-degrading endonuclease toxin of MazEF toxin-antitoxin module
MPSCGWSALACEDVKSVSEQRLINRLGTVDDEVMFQAARTLRFLLDL